LCFHLGEFALVSPAIKNMSVAQLLGLKDDIDKLLKSKRSELEMQLKLISGEVHEARPKSPKTKSIKGQKGRSGKVVAKYRHPTTGETWSGRGVTAGWLAAEIKAGKKKEDYLISRKASKKAEKVD
jgi:DNA-binding protein H-NS